MRILHCCDLHIGRLRLGLEETGQDFINALGALISRALTWPAQAVVCSGDLLDRPQVTVERLLSVKRHLEPLREARIPFICIEGNRDLPADPWEDSWLHYLQAENLLILLQPEFTPEGPILEPYDPRARQGAVFTWGGVQFAGFGYLPPGFEWDARALGEALPQDGPLVVLAHASQSLCQPGPDGRRPLADLDGYLDYLALGHGHRPLVWKRASGEIWAANPGAPENVHLNEAYLEGPRGWAEIELQQGAQGWRTNVRLCDSPRRPVVKAPLDLEAFGNQTKHGLENLKAAALRAIAGSKAPAEAIVHLALKGALHARRFHLDPVALGQQLAQEACVAGVWLDLAQVQFYAGRGPKGAAAGSAEGVVQETRARIEERLVRELLDKQPLEGLADGPALSPRALEEQIQATLEWKELAAEGQPDEVLLNQLKRFGSG